jgi:hypothetical protein
VGQLLIVLLILITTALFTGLFRVKRREWMLLLSGGAGSISLLMVLERFPL